LRAAGNAQVERLLLVGVVASGDIAADDEREVALAKIILECGGIDAFLDEDLLFRRGEWIGASLRASASANFDRIEFPHGAVIGDEVIGLIPTDVGSHAADRVPRSAELARGRFDAVLTCKSNDLSMQPVAVSSHAPAQDAELSFARLLLLLRRSRSSSSFRLRLKTLIETKGGARCTQLFPLLVVFSIDSNARNGQIKLHPPTQE
jgi:hypothetical protein